MITRLVFGIALLLAAPWSLLAEVQFNSFEDYVAAYPSEQFSINDLYVDTNDNPWLSSVFCCELDSGFLYQATYGAYYPEYRWICFYDAPTYDSWVGPGILPYFDVHEILPGVSSDLEDLDVNITLYPDPVQGTVPPWDGIVARVVFSPDAVGRWALKVSEKGAGLTYYNGTITNGRIDWPPPIEGDLTFDGFVDEADLDILKANWGGDPIIRADLSSGDPSQDGAVTSADLDIVRANWAGGPPASTVPEPGWCGLMGVLFFFYGLGRRRWNVSRMRSIRSCR